MCFRFKTFTDAHVLQPYVFAPPFLTFAKNELLFGSF
jgi:hypothetical protein